MSYERVIDVAGRDIWTEMMGDPKSPVVLLISGAGAHAHFWSDSFCHQVVEKGFCVIRYDHRDCGLSSPSEKKYLIQELVDDAIAVLDGYNVEKAHVVGHSMGGYIVQFMAISHPDRLLSVTIMSAGPAGNTPTIVKPYDQEEKEEMYATWRVMSQNRPTADFEESYPAFHRVWERLNGTLPIDEDLARNYTRELYTRSRYPVEAHKKHMHTMQKVAEALKDNSDMFRKIKLPVLIIHGDSDYLVNVSRGGAALAEVLPQAEFEKISGMGHMFFNYDLENLLADKLTQFLQKHGDIVD